jgi:hypothetical protein
MHISDATPASANLYFHSGRSAIGRSVLAAIIVLVVVGVAAVAVISRGPGVSSSTSSSSSGSSSVASSSSSSKTSSSGGLNITNMITDVTGGFQPPSGNSTTYGNNQTTYIGSVGDAITLTVDIEYTNCQGKSCPSVVNTVGVTGFNTIKATPSTFEVQEVDSGQGLPEPFGPTTGTGENCILIVTIQAPDAPFTGPLTLTVQVG